MANVLGELFGSIASAIREKTGETDTMKPAEFPAKIAAIETGGGGSSADVCYVSFMSHDGTVEYGKKAVAVGDDCADPIARGVFDTPTRESDVQYNYTFAGWATTINGGLDSNALKAVEKDRTLYANYIASVRYYTITYYDSDGTTVLKTESLAYGSTPSYTPTKSGYGFGGWQPTVTAVTGAASYTATWETVITFANASWEQIAAISEAGEAESYFAVGDTKTLTLTFSDATENVKVRIVGFNHDDLESGDKAGISIVFAQAVENTAVLATENTKYGTGYIWETSVTRTKMNSSLGSVYTAFPSELQSVLKPVIKTSNAGYSTSYGGREKNSLYTTVDKIWLPSTTELGMDGIYSATYVALNQGSQYPYYDSASKRSMYTTAGANVIYPTRSMQDQYANSIVCVHGSYPSDKYYGTLGETQYAGRVMGFCI